LTESGHILTDPDQIAVTNELMKRMFSNTSVRVTNRRSKVATKSTDTSWMSSLVPDTRQQAPFTTRTSGLDLEANSIVSDPNL